MLTDRLTANLSVSLFLWDKITHLKDIKMPFGTLVPSLLIRLFQRGCNTRITALERSYQQLWNKYYNCYGTVVTTMVERLEQPCLCSSSNYLIVIHTNPSMSILYISCCGVFTLDMNISICQFAKNKSESVTTYWKIELYSLRFRPYVVTRTG